MQGSSVDGAPAGEDSPRIFVPPPIVLGLLGLVAVTLERQLPSSFGCAGIVDRVLRGLGWTLVGLGLSLDGSALWRFLSQRTSPLPFRPASVFVVRGPYRWTRNPMYLGMLALGIGAGLVTDSLWWLPATAIFWSWLDRWVVPREECYLERRFGDTYRDYRQRVPRWIGSRVAPARAQGLEQSFPKP